MHHIVIASLRALCERALYALFPPCHLLQLPIHLQYHHLNTNHVIAFSLCYHAFYLLYDNAPITIVRHVMKDYEQDK